MQGPLKGDPKRQAVSSIRGIEYQKWQSFLAWINLGPDEEIYLECAEDFDRVLKNGNAEAVQVKDIRASLTLNSPEIVNCINNYWTTKNENPTRKIKLTLLTTATIAQEQGSPFGPGKMGINVWKEVQKKEKVESINLIRSLLLKKLNLNEGVKRFLSDNIPSEIKKTLIDPISWETSKDSYVEVRDEVRDQLILHGEEYSVSPKECSLASDVLMQKMTEIMLGSSGQDRCLRRVDFLREFHEATKVSLGREQLEKISKFMETLTGLMGDSQGLSVRQTIIDELPGVPSFAIKRPQILGEVLKKLSIHGFVLIHGTSGSGKTIFSKQLAELVGGDWKYIDFENLLPDEIKSKLGQVYRLVFKTPMQGIVLDNIDLAPEKADVFRKSLVTVLNTLSSKKIKIIISSQFPTPVQIRAQLALSAETEKELSHFSMVEVKEFASSLGCPETLSDTVSKVVTLHTQGHPQLVHAMLMQQKEEGWAGATWEKLFQTPDVVERTRSDVRQILQERLNKNKRDLLYRLSVADGWFKREHAIQIAANNPAIENPGVLFDSLIGPWIETVTGEYFRLSPLLKDAAKNVWTSEEFTKFQSDISVTYLLSKTITQIEARQAFMLSWLGKNDGVLTQVILALLQTKDENHQRMADEFSWFAHIGFDPGRPLYEGKYAINTFMRLLQLKIAVIKEPDICEMIIEKWEQETPRSKSHKLDRLMFIFQALMFPELRLMPRRAISWIIEAMDDIDEIPEFRKVKYKKFKKMNGSENLLSYSGMLFWTIGIKARNLEFIDELVTALSELDPGSREKLLSEVKNDASLFDFIINRGWSSEVKTEKPRRDYAVAVLKKTITLGVEWRINVLAEAACCSLAAIYDESFNDRETAFAELDKCEKIIGETFAIHNARAIIFYNQKKYDVALEIWEKILPSWTKQKESLDISPGLSYRLAALSAGKTNQFVKAAKLFEDARGALPSSSMEHMKVGLVADAGYCFWRQGEYQKAIERWKISLLEAEKLPNPMNDFETFATNKLLGHLIGATAYSEGPINPPELGQCSQTNKNREIKNLPETPLNMIWGSLAELESEYLDADDVLKEALKRIQGTNDYRISFMITDAGLKSLIKNGNYKELPVLAIKFIESIHSYARELKHEDGIQKSDFLKDTNSLVNAVKSFHYVLLLGLWAAEKPIKAVIEQWEQILPSIKEEFRSDLSSFYRLVKEGMECTEEEAEKILKGPSELFEKQFGASIFITNVEKPDPNLIFRAHLNFLQTSTMLTSYRRITVDFVKRLSEQWNRLVLMPIKIRDYASTIPKIQAACKLDKNNLEKALRILREAYRAVNVSLSSEAIQWLNKLQKEERNN
jgi:tetratricopeptide (TPR) repeat protein